MCNQLTTKWYAVYTYPNAERKVYNKVLELGDEAYLPMHTVIRQWSDRKKKMDVPMFPGYVFVKTSLADRFRILSINGLVKFVAFSEGPVTIPDEDIQALKEIALNNLAIHKESYKFRSGKKVRIMDGQLAGIEGYVLRKGARERLVIQVEALKQAIGVEVPVDQLELSC